METDVTTTLHDTAGIFESVNHHIHRDSGLHLYVQVRDYLRDRIEEGELKPGQSVPPHRRLSELCGVSEITVRRAVQDLVREGLLTSRAGSGTFVVGPAGQATDGASGRPTPSPSSSTLRIGIVVTSLTDGYPFISHVIRGVRDCLPPDALLQFFEQPSGEGEAARKRLTELPLHDLSGLILPSPVNIALVAHCQRIAMPYVLTYNDLADNLSHCVLVDYASGILEAMTYLARTGRQRIALVTASAGRMSAGLMTAAYHMALKHLELETSDDWIIGAGYGEAHGYEAASRLLRMTPRPDAIVFASDYQVKGALLAAQEAGINVPRELAMIGVGNVLRPKEAAIELTTIDTHVAQIGRVGMRMLHRLIAGEDNVPLRQVVVPSLIIRDSA